MGQVRKCVLERQFSDVERAADVADAFIHVEDRHFTDGLGLVIVALTRPGIGGPAFVSELTERLPWIPVLVLSRGTEEALRYSGANIRFLSQSASTSDLVAYSRHILDQQLARRA